MSLDNLHPFTGQHAIQSAVFALSFSSELDIGEVGSLQAASAALKGDFPVLAEQQRTTISMQVGPGAKSSPDASSEVGGFILERPALVPNEPKLRLIIVNRTDIVVVVNDYTRWDKFTSDIDRYLSVLLAPIDSHKAISSIGLQFNDVFLWKADPVELNLDEVFVNGSPYLPSNVFSSTMLWHSHHGYLINEAAPVKHQQLDNINVSRVEVQGEHQLQILTSHRATFENPLYKGWSDKNLILFNIRENLHKTNKKLLAALLTPAAQQKINLNGAE